MINYANELKWHCSLASEIKNEIAVHQASIELPTKSQILKLKKLELKVRSLIMAQVCQNKILYSCLEKSCDKAISGGLMH